MNNRGTVWLLQLRPCLLYGITIFRKKNKGTNFNNGKHIENTKTQNLPWKMGVGIYKTQGRKDNEYMADFEETAKEDFNF